jgi:hypothetical protein
MNRGITLLGAAGLGADPKQEMDDDLMRMKTHLESGIPAHDAAARAGQSQAQHGEPAMQQGAGI